MGFFKDKFNVSSTNELLPSVDEKQPVKPVETGGFFNSKFGQPKPIKKADLTTLPGLEQTAIQAGLNEEAREITKPKEIPKEIFSGGFITDVFDTLNVLQHGVVGLVKGQSFKEGVKTRASFSDKDALGDLGTPGVIAGIILDIAFDPLTYVGGLGLVGKLSKAPKIAKVASKAKKALAATKAGNLLGRSFIYRFGQDPIYKTIAERSEKAIAIGTRNLVEIAKPLAKLDGKTQKTIADFRKAGKLEDLPKELLDTAKPVFNEVDRLGKEAVNVGLLKKETYEQNVGKYIARLYRKHEAPGGVVDKIKTFFDSKPLKIDVSRFKKRTDIPEDVREAMGEILEAGYPTAKGLVQLNQAIERAKFFKEVAGKWAKDTIEYGFVKLSDTKRLGELAGKAVPKPIFDDIQEIIRTKTPLQKGVGKVVAGFKFGKVIMNPATHARNIMSNFVLNNFEGLNPARLDIYGEAAKQIATKGKWYKEAREVGLGLDTFASREIKDMLIGPEVSTLGKGLKNKTKQAMGKIADLYQKEEEFAKMAQYIFQRKKGLTPDKAWEVAERATFNYAQVTPFIRKLRESIFGFPFITFTVKATPQVAKTLVTKPTKISNIGKIKNAIESQSDLEELTRERASEPPWVRDGFYVKLPIKDKTNRSAYIDLTYILPFGDLLSGQLVGRNVNRETGLPESIAGTALEKTPLLNLIKELGKNQDFYGNKIWKESDPTDKQLGDLMRHLTRLYSPPLISDQIPGGYRADGTRRPALFTRIAEEQRRTEQGGSQSRNLTQELLRNVGIKISPVDVELQETFNEFNQKKALRTLLGEEGVTSEFSIPFISN